LLLIRKITDGDLFYVSLIFALNNQDRTGRNLKDSLLAQNLIGNRIEIPVSDPSVPERIFHVFQGYDCFAFRKEGKTFRYAAKRIGKHFHGTGDLFAAVFTAALTRGKRAEDAACLAARFTERVIAATEESSPFGIAFEPELPWLVGQL
jgi:hypothetical protein